MSKSIKVMGIDPGINHTGWNIGLFYPETKKIVISTYGTIQANSLAKKEHKNDYTLYGTTVSLYLYEQELISLIEQHNPAYVTCEDAFMHKFPQAFVSLKLCIASIQRVLYQNYNRTLYLIAPRAAKLAVWGNGDASKHAIQEAIQQLPDLTIKNTKQHPISAMCEHEADSIAITYTFIKNVLPDILIQNQTMT